MAVGHYKSRSDQLPSSAEGNRRFAHVVRTTTTRAVQAGNEVSFW